MGCYRVASSRHLLAVFLIGTVGTALAEGRCPDGYFPIGGGSAGWEGGAPMGPEPAHGQEPDRQLDGPQWDTRWGAIARGKAGGWGAVSDMLTERSAQKAALKQCENTASTKRAGCKVAITYYNQCAVYVWGSAGGVSSSAIDVPTASERATALCKKSSNDCELLYSNCSYPRRID